LLPKFHVALYASHAALPMVTKNFAWCTPPNVELKFFYPFNTEWTRHQDIMIDRPSVVTWLSLLILTLTSNWTGLSYSWRLYEYIQGPVPPDRSVESRTRTECSHWPWEVRRCFGRDKELDVVTRKCTECPRWPWEVRRCFGRDEELDVSTGRWADRFVLMAVTRHERSVVSWLAGWLVFVAWRSTE
jgi:hypothetical protein